MNKQILIHTACRSLTNGGPHPKNWPTENWTELVLTLQKRGYEMVQLMSSGDGSVQVAQNTMIDVPLHELEKIVSNRKQCRTYICVDSFLHHMAASVGVPGIVIFSQSDPKIFGHALNFNLIEDKSYIRWNQWDRWECCNYLPSAFVSVKKVLETFDRFIEQKDSAT